MSVREGERAVVACRIINAVVVWVAGTQLLLELCQSSVTLMKQVESTVGPGK